MPWGAPRHLEIAYHAFRHFQGAGELEARALELLAEESLKGYRHKRRAVARALVELGPAAENQLRAIASESDDDVCRWVAVGGLAGHLVAEDTPEALDLLLRSYRYPTSGTREHALRVFASFQASVAMDPYRKALRSKRFARQMKPVLVEALGFMSGEGVREELLRSLKARDASIQLAAISALERRGYTGHTEVLRRLQNAQDPALRRAAFAAQAKHHEGSGTDEWRERVLAAARGDDQALRLAAARVLTGLVEPAGLDEIGYGKALVELHRLLADERHAVRAEALRGVAQLGRVESVPALVERMGRDSLRMRDRLRAVLVSLTGEDHGTSGERWSAWWAAAREGFRLPSPEEASARERERAEERADNPTQASFYGIRFRSDRASFVIDISGSMNLQNRLGRARIDLVKDELVRTLESYPEGGLFNLVFFSSRVAAWKRGLVAMDEKTRKAGIRFARRKAPGGDTALYDGLLRACEDPEVDTIFLLSDGEPTAGKLVDPEAILLAVERRSRVEDVVIHTVSVHRRSRLLESLSRLTGGEYREVE